MGCVRFMQRGSTAAETGTEPGASGSDGHGGTETLEDDPMNAKNTEQPMTCDSCRAIMQEYLDETLPGPRATQLFLHVRDCQECHRELEALKAMFGMLGAMPAIEAPTISTPGSCSRFPWRPIARWSLRRTRVPVILSEESLPSFLRSNATRTVGLVIAAGAVVGLAAGRLPDTGAAIVALGTCPRSSCVCSR